MAPRQPKPPQLQCLAAAAAGAARHPAAGPGGRAGHEAHFLVAEHLRRIGRYDPDRRDALALQPCCDGAGLGGGIDHQAAPCADAAWPGPAGAAGPDRCAADRSDRVAARWRVLAGLALLPCQHPSLSSAPAQRCRGTGPRFHAPLPDPAERQTRGLRWSSPGCGSGNATT